MITQKDLDRICELANIVEDKLQDLDTTTLTGLLDEVHVLQSYATELRGMVEDVELDGLGELVPEVMSAGEADSLRDAMNEWRVKNGYSRI